MALTRPLGPMLFMLKDMNTVSGRAMQLATHLFALRTCIEGLRGLPLVGYLRPAGYLFSRER
jgi:hypothetical protein